MSTLRASADLSSDEEDADFVPDSPKRKSVKRLKTPDMMDEVEAKRIKVEEEDERRRRAADAFRAMREESCAGASSRSQEIDVGEKVVEMVVVKRARRFAGETL